VAKARGREAKVLADSPEQCSWALHRRKQKQTAMMAASKRPKDKVVERVF